MFQGLTYLPSKIAGIPGETLGVFFFGALAAAVFAVPWLDRRGKRGIALAAVVILALAAVGLLAALAAFFPWELGVKADPFAPAPAGIRPEWYFLWMFQGLKYLPSKIAGIPGETLGVFFFGALAAAVVAVPWLDRRGKGGIAVAAVVILALAAVLTVLALLPASSVGPK
jgi:quinol-cytochrome oxidoreductase complex cytochrome b subunit